MIQHLILVINYRNEKEVITYAKELEKQSISNVIGLVVIDNKSSENLDFNLEIKLSQIKIKTWYYKAESNLGYINGCFWGYTQFLKNELDHPKWIYISNTDIEIREREFFKSINDANYEPNIWCVAPSVYSSKNKSYDNPQYKKRTNISKINQLIWIFERPLISFVYLKMADIKAKFKRKQKEPSQYVYSVHGCFFGLKNQFADYLLMNQFEAFLYSEEAYIAENLLILNKKAYYDSTIEIIHNENSSTGLLNTKKKLDFMVNSLKYIKNKFYYDLSA